MPGRLSSPRFRRRLIRVSLLGAVVGAGALVSILFWNTATVVETPLHGTADMYTPPIPVKMAAAERRQVIATAARFVDTAVKRDHAERAFELVGPSLRNGTTKANWREGDIPVVPYPVDDARWTFDYSYADEIGLQVAVFPAAGATCGRWSSTCRSAPVGLGRSGAGSSTRGRRAAGVAAARPSRSDGSPFRVDAQRRPEGLRRASAPCGSSFPPA